MIAICVCFSGLWGLLMVSVGTMGPFWPGDSPFRTMGEGLWAVSKVESLACVPRLPRFILLISFSDTLLVVSILDIVYDCNLGPLFCSPEGVKHIQ